MFEPKRYAGLFGLLGGILAGSAASLAGSGAIGAAWVLVAAQAYVAFCLLSLALAYALNHLGVPIEEVFQHPGRRQALDLLLLPYRLLARMVCALLRRFDTMEMMHPVGHRLYVGRAPGVSDRPRLKELGITSILNLCAEFPRQHRGSGLDTSYLPILDGAAPSSRQLQTAVDWIEARHREGRSVLVHCAHGRGRSVTVAAAALCRLGLADGPDDALARITAVRPKARPSEKQKVALARFLSAATTE